MTEWRAKTQRVFTSAQSVSVRMNKNEDRDPVALNASMASVALPRAGNQPLIAVGRPDGVGSDGAPLLASGAR